MSGGRTSAWRSLHSGVPQGSVWGPLAFALYSADVGEYVTAARIVAYADDITLVCSHKNPAQARAAMDTALQQLDEWARRNRIAPEPTKTQLMVSAPHKRMKELRELTCTMGEHNIKPSEVVKVLGILIDEQMTWDAHSAAASKKANAAIWAVARAAHHLTVKERATLMKSLALPHLDGCQSALANPCARARVRVQRTYNKSARAAVWGLRALYRWGSDGEPKWKQFRSAPARKHLRWLAWEQRRAAARASLTAKIFHTGEPAALRQLLPSLTLAALHKRRLRSHTKGCVVTFAAQRVFGEKAFSYWGPRVLNAIARDSIYDSCPMGSPDLKEEEEERMGNGRPPADDKKVDRRAWYAELRDKFADQRERRDEEGRVRVWTDGSRCHRGGRMCAGAGIFYGYKNELNRALKVPGRQCNARAELFALLHVLRTEHRPALVRSDCRYVVDGVNTWRFAWRARAWFEKPLEGQRIANYDLWQEVDRLLELREMPLEVKWTKGHPLRGHLREEVTTELDAYGNVGSDFLAGVASGSDTPAHWTRAQRVAQQPGLVDGG
eukprot:gene37283-biopygen32826